MALAGLLGCKGGARANDNIRTDPPPQAPPPARFTHAQGPTAPTREAAAAAHQVALGELETVLAQNYRLHNINISDDFRQAKAAAERALAGHKDEPGPRINLAYLWADPYLSRHAQDIHTLMPHEVTEEAWHALKQAVYAYPNLANPRELDSTFGVIERSDPISRSITRKRLFRLYQNAQDRDQADSHQPAEHGEPRALTHMQDF